MTVPPVRLLVVGDVAWDILVRPERELVWGSDVFGTVELMPGGAAANVAVWARRLGAVATLAGRVGQDVLGELMLRHLLAEGVTSRIATVADTPTTRIGIVIDPRGEHGFVIDHAKPQVLTAADLPFALLDDVDGIYFNGYAIFMSESAAFLAPLLSEARRRRIPIAFDPSSFTLIRDYGPGRLLAELGPLDVVLANEEEARALCPGQALSALQQAAGLVVVKQGAEGASAFGTQGTWCAEPAPADVVDTTGAGDGFDAAFLVEWLSGRGVEAGLRAGNRLGAHVASHLGAQPPLPASISSPTTRA